MPQPLSKVTSCKDVEIGNGIFERVPELAIKALQVINTWSFIDQTFTAYLAKLLKTDYELVIAMYESLTSAGQKEALIRTAMQRTLSAEDYALFKSVQRVTEPARGARNLFAHHLWAASPAIHNGLLLIDPSTITQTDIQGRARADQAWKTFNALQTLEERLDFVNNKQPPMPEIDCTKVMVYRTKDLEEVVSQTTKAKIYFDLFFDILGNVKDGAKCREALLGEKIIQQDMENERRRKQRAKGWNLPTGLKPFCHPSLAPSTWHKKPHLRWTFDESLHPHSDNQ